VDGVADRPADERSTPELEVAGRSRNVKLAMASLVCAMSCIFVLGSTVPNYLVDHLRLTPVQMGAIMSALGLHGFFGESLIAAGSDYMGRKPVAVLCFVAATVCLYLFTKLGSSPMMLFVLLFL
jgi:predicted MFS family arabinose efflux permease